MESLEEALSHKSNERSILTGTFWDEVARIKGLLTERDEAWPRPLETWTSHGALPVGGKGRRRKRKRHGVSFPFP